ncbi:MAG: carboxypeptidase-like regulatory domain-containing protein [Methanolinea sp.]|nr:carboxypeptidase-like regulatory domain-containing protein [Methanolinea sp.]
MEREGDAGIDEVIGTILLVVLVIALVAIIGGIVFGYITLQPKSAYIPPRVAVVDYAGGKAISLYSRGGDPAVLDPSQEGRYVLGFYLDTGRGTFKAVPDPGVATWNPGETIYIYYDASAEKYRVGGRVPAYPPGQIPDAKLYLRVVDERAKLLVLKEGIGEPGGGTGTPTTTPTTVPTTTPTTTPPTTTPTTVPTTTPTTTPPTTIPTTTPTATPIPACGTITGRVVNNSNNVGIPGVTIQYRYRENQGQAPWTPWYSTVTGAGGTYAITGVPYNPAHFYQVTVVVPPGYSGVSPSIQEFILNPGNCYQTGINFSLLP